VSTERQDEGAVKTDEAAVEAAELNLIYAHITAPISGQVGLRSVDPGNQVHATDVTGLMVITQTHPIAVIFVLPEDSLSAVLQKIGGNKTALTAEAYNRDKTQKLATGRLLAVDNQIDPTTGTSKLKAVFDNKDDALFPNQFVNIRLLLESRENQVIVPAVAIQRGSQGTFVYVIKPDNAVEARPVTVGLTEGNDTTVDKGLTVGENVVVDGADKLQPGSKVSVAPPHHPS
jgi:membrane fusion protein, multidrug efflux system